ncbi:MAG: DUF3037 domain-containing protein [Rhodocyclaceae bacterium]|nr:DUF3037 domain-containing protein [Rhodocyclaceae bacterium]MCA3074182.1 DUF3037 domain-containing protein [Rhodocyclaceae bacterium]MCA3095097.1 DUF3037 domain-containing protein [Rhodocyclaceae bacterium]MCA3097173.1 DUF3037 domain-containing protein [Rhodocyclaceae bacterium]MCA3102827.1 DUF3037 domain-containing protein [Rhodocyclaceae bacterium]
MSNKTAYTYTVLRYVHDIGTGEFLNVGVALLVPECHYVNARCRTTYKRLKDVFPSLDGDSFRSSMRHVTHEFEWFQAELNAETSVQATETGVMRFAHAVLGADDSSLQWSPMGAGLTADPGATLEQLYDRFVTAHEPRAQVPRRQDEDVWKRFSLELEKRQVLPHFVKKTIAVDDDQVEFKHAWKNGAWHCLAPVSFDLASADSIRDKAHKWLGQLTSVAKAKEKFKLYFLVAEPSQKDLRPAYESALSILAKSSVDQEVVPETGASELSERLAKEVRTHEKLLGRPMH